MMIGMQLFRLIMKQKMKRLTVILLAFVVTFTTIPAAGGLLDVHAASSVKGIKAYAAGTSSANLYWSKLSKKQQKKVTGITIFRNGVAIKNLSKKSTSYTDSGLAAGTVYNYQIKTYKKTTKKVKMWKNKKTGQLQKKKPSKKQKKNFKKVTIKKTTYKYSKASTVKKIRTAAASSSGSGSNTSGGGSSFGGGSSQPSTPVTPTTEVRTVTDYKGVTRTITKQKDSTGASYWLTSDGFLVEDSATGSYTNGLARVDRTIDGEFKVSNTEMLQTGGATFNKSQLEEQIVKDTILSRVVAVDMYNGDPSKLLLSIDRPIETVNTYNISRSPVRRQYVMKDGYRLVEYAASESTKDNITTKKAYFINLRYDLLCCGFVSGDITVTITYDGKKIGSTTVDPNPTADSSGMHPNRALYLSIAQAAIEANGGRKSYEKDMAAIANYVYENYNYPPDTSSSGIGPTYFNCIGGAKILETYSIYAYGRYGFIATPPGYTNESHMEFSPEDEPNKCYGAQGSA